MDTPKHYKLRGLPIWAEERLNATNGTRVTRSPKDTAETTIGGHDVVFIDIPQGRSSLPVPKEYLEPVGNT